MQARSGAVNVDQRAPRCFRAPHVIRLVPLSTTYHEIWQAAQTLREIIDTGAHLRLAEGRELVA